MTEIKANHQANVVRLGEPRVHTNADTLELFDIGGYQIVTKKGTFKAGDLAVYIQPDSVVPQTEPFKFIWEPYVSAPDTTQTDIVPTVPERRRRITVRKFRKEWSEGLLMPLSDFTGVGKEFIEKTIVGSDGVTLGENLGNTVNEGDDVSCILGIKHYVPACDVEAMQKDFDNTASPRRRYPRSLRGWWFYILNRLGIRSVDGCRALALETGFNFPVYDVEAYKNHKNWMPEGTLVQVTEKIHGSNARYVFIDGTFYAGSRNEWKRRGDNIWWNAARQFPEIEEFCTQNEGKVLYGEVGPTQGVLWRYGVAEKMVFFYAFDVYDPIANTWNWAGSEGFTPHVPILYSGPFGQAVLDLVDGQTTIPGATGMREGIVVRKIGDLSDLNRLKIVSNAFLEKDSK